jgi:hypothetical protein
MLGLSMFEEIISPLHHHVQLNEIHTGSKNFPYVSLDQLIHLLGMLVITPCGKVGN